MSFYEFFHVVAPGRYANSVSCCVQSRKINIMAVLALLPLLLLLLPEATSHRLIVHSLVAHNVYATSTVEKLYMNSRKAFCATKLPHAGLESFIESERAFTVIFFWVWMGLVGTALVTFSTSLCLIKFNQNFSPLPFRFNGVKLLHHKTLNSNVETISC